MDGGMLWRNGCDGKVLRCGAGDRHQQEGEEEEGEEVIKNMVKHGEIRVDLGLKWNGWMDLSRTKWTSAQECVIKCDMLNGGVHYQRLWHVNKGREGREVKTLFPLKTLFLEGKGSEEAHSPNNRTACHPRHSHRHVPQVFYTQDNRPPLS